MDTICGACMSFDEMYHWYYEDKRGKLIYFVSLAIHVVVGQDQRVLPCCNSYVNVSDQTSIFTHETKMLILICWKCFLAFNVLNMTRTDG